MALAAVLALLTGCSGKKGILMEAVALPFRN